MDIYSVTNISEGMVVQQSYDLAIFATGYEARAAYLSSLTDSQNIKNTIVLGFEELRSDEKRQRNDAHFLDKYKVNPELVRANDETGIYEILTRKTPKEVTHILIDYTSMSRIWYSAVINWFRAIQFPTPVKLDFCYTPGKYIDGIAGEKVIEDIICIPGCEGAALGNRDTVCIFGLGFDPIPPFSVIERMEPQEVFAFYANPGASTDYPGRALSINNQFLQAFVKSDPVPLSLFDIEDAYGRLAELITPFRNNMDISLIPLGPKPHVLASILLSLKFADVSCLHVKGAPSRAAHIEAAGPVVATRIELK